MVSVVLSQAGPIPGKEANPSSAQLLNSQIESCTFELNRWQLYLLIVLATG